MGPRGKALTSLLLIIIVILAVWQFTSPALIPAVGTKYLSSTQYANRGSWVLLNRKLDLSSDDRPYLILAHYQQGERDNARLVRSRPYREDHLAPYPGQLRWFHFQLGAIRKLSRRSPSHDPLQLQNLSKPSAQVHDKLPALRDPHPRLAHRSLLNSSVQRNPERRLNIFRFC